MHNQPQHPQSQHSRPHHPLGAASRHGATPPRGKPAGTPTSSATSSPEPNPPVPLAPEMERALDTYRKTGPSHPDAMGCPIAQLVATEMGIYSRLQRLCDTYLAQPGLEFRDIMESHQILEIKNTNLKQLKALAAFEYQLRKKRMETDNPVESISYHVKPETTPLSPDAKRIAELAMEGKLPPAPPDYSNLSPVFPEKPTESEKSPN